MKLIQIRKALQEDINWISRISQQYWNSNKIVTKGKVYYIDKLPALIALIRNKKVGLLIYNVMDKECEIISLNSMKANRGIGKALLKAVEEIAQDKECTRLFLITTNDNLNALGFYQKNGFSICSIYPNAIENSRLLKPEIPYLGENGISIRDEIELEKILIN